MTTAAGRRLTEQHRLEQLRLRNLVLRELISIWPAFDENDIDGTWTNLEPAVMFLVEKYRLQSAAIAGAYYRAFRNAEGVRARLNALPPEQEWRTAALVSLRVTGPIYTKSAIANRQPNVRAEALVRLSGAVTRIVLNGGRAVLLRYGVSET